MSQPIQPGRDTLTIFLAGDVMTGRGIDQILPHPGAQSSAGTARAIFGIHMPRLNDIARPLDGGPGDFDPIIDRIGNAPIVLIGEASHGTHEFYEARARLTQRLIAEHGFGAIVAEADWPDAYRVNRYVRNEGSDSDSTADEALVDFQRFPTWMWRNTVVESFIEWMRSHNNGLAVEARVGFYDMDLYSMFRSIAKVLEFLDKVDPDASARARERYACFGQFGDRAELYGHAAGSAPGQVASRPPLPSSWTCARMPSGTSRGIGSAPSTRSFVPSKTRVSCRTPRRTTAECSVVV